MLLAPTQSVPLGGHKNGVDPERPCLRVCSAQTVRALSRCRPRGRDCEDSGHLEARCIGTMAMLGGRRFQQGCTIQEIFRAGMTDIIIPFIVAVFPPSRERRSPAGWKRCRKGSARPLVMVGPSPSTFDNQPDCLCFRFAPLQVRLSCPRGPNGIPGSQGFPNSQAGG